MIQADDFRGGGQFDQDFFDDPEGEYEGEDEEMDEEEQAAMEEALALNEQLRQMLELQAQQEQQEQGLVRRAPGGPMQQQQRRMMPAQDPGAQGKKKSNYTFDKHEMEAMGSENQRLLNRMIAIKTNRVGPCPLALPPVSPPPPRVSISIVRVCRTPARVPVFPTTSNTRGRDMWQRRRSTGGSATTKSPERT